MLKASWSAAIDCVGGNILTTLLRSVDYGGIVTACGMVAGADLSISVFPFILRGINLAGIDSVNTPMPLREQIWQKLATDWYPTGLEKITTEIGLESLPEAFEKIMAAENIGRIVVAV